MFMVLLILDNAEQWEEVINGWEKAGASGVTVLPSTGLGRIRRRIGLKDDLPLLPSLDDFIEEEETRHHTLFSIVREREVVDAIVKATQNIIGDLNRPHTGILVVLPVVEVYGLDRYAE